MIGIATEVVVFVGWFAALFTGRAPDFVRGLVTIYLRLSVRLGAYMYLLTDKYPTFSFDETPGDVTRLAVPEGTRLNRWAVFFRFILAIPAFILMDLVAIGIAVFIFFMWIVTLIAGRLPASVHTAYCAALRYQTRVSAYFFLLVPTYPRGLFGDTAPVTPVPATGWTAAGSAAAGWTAAGSADAGLGGAEASPKPEWTLTVGTSAKRVLILAIVLGALAYVAIGVSSSLSSSSSINQSVQQQQLIDANNVLVDGLNQYQSAASACEANSDVSCLESADRAFAQQLSTFAGTLNGVSNSGVDQNVIDRAAADANHLSFVFKKLGDAGPTPASYQRAVNQLDPSANADRLQRSLNRLHSALTNASG